MVRCSYSDDQVSPVGTPNFLVATPYWGAIDAEHLDSVMALRRLYPDTIARHFQVRGCAYIDIARATAAQAALDGGYDGLFFVDHDVIFDPRELIGMMRAAEFAQTVVYGLYSMRRSGDRMIGAFHPDVKHASCFAGGGLYPGFDGGLGFAAIPRVVLEAVGAHMLPLKTGERRDGKACEVKPLFALRSAMQDWPELFERLATEGLLTLDGEIGREEFARVIASMHAGGWYAGEDISFFSRVRRAGFAPLVDTRPRLAHHGAYRYGLEDVQLVVPRGETLELDLVRVESLDNPHDRALLDASAARSIASNARFAAE